MEKQAKRAKSTVEADIYEIERFDVRFVGGEFAIGKYVDPFPFEKAANSAWTVKKWRTTRWEPYYQDFGVEVLAPDGTPVHGKTLLSNLRAMYLDDDEYDVEAEVFMPSGAEGTQERGQGGDAGSAVTTVRHSGTETTAPTDIYDIADRLWATADELRANSHLKAAEYSIPVLGLIFLKFADSRFTQAEAELAGRSTGRRQIGKADYQARGVLYLPEEA